MQSSINKAEENLVKEKEKFEALFQYASMGILATDTSGNITMANNFLVALFGYHSVEELIGKKIEQLIPQRYHDKHVHHRDHYHENPKAMAK